MKLHRSEIVAFVMILLSFVVGWYFYPMLPERVASHWNAQGDVNGTMPRFWGAFLMPLIVLIILAIFMVVPRIDPKRENIEKFRKYLDAFIIVISLFFIYVYGLTLALNLGYHFSLIPHLLPALAVLLYSAGLLISKSEQNWTIGIRTPWALSSETVWRKTHKLGGMLFKIAAVVVLVGTAFPGAELWFILFPILMAALVPTVYSYFWYRDEKRQN
ncbi:MAG: SdpI family protein [Candidatus Jorgensenbacteria bacterium]